MVKRFIRDRSAEWLDKPEWPEPKRNPDFSLKPVIRRALAPSPEEQKRNPRSRSAKLRVAERISNETTA